MSVRTAGHSTFLMPDTRDSKALYPLVGLIFLAGYLLAAICQNSDVIAMVKGQFLGT